MVRIIDGIDGLRALVGEELGVSDWLPIEQSDVDDFARTTRDDYWLHTDPDRAKAESPFDGTILHGLLTLSLGPGFSYEIFAVKGFDLGVNYGYGKVRFPAPAPVGSRIRMRAALTALDELPGGVTVTVTQTFEREGSEKPVCVADSLTRLLFSA